MVSNTEVAVTLKALLIAEFMAQILLRHMEIFHQSMLLFLFKNRFFMPVK